MKLIFTISGMCVVIAFLITEWFLNEGLEDKPVLYWVTDPNPVRAEQVDLFHRWLKKNNLPDMEMRLDTDQGNGQKRLIHGVSGVASDIITVGGSSDAPFFKQIGLLRNLDLAAANLGFDPSRTYPALRPLIVYDKVQYAFPFSASNYYYWVNKKTFARYRQDPPPERWDFDTFEKLGKKFVEAANPPGQRREVFFANLTSYARENTIFRRSLGLSIFNETLTACILDDRRNVEVYNKIYKWIYEDHIFPSAADEASFASGHGYGGFLFQLFNQGNYGMVIAGRWALIQFREFENMALDTVEFPHGGFPNGIITTRCASVYAGSKHPQLAELFLAYLASEDYNMQIVDCADGLPSNPRYIQTEAFLHPPKYPNEWGIHEKFSNRALTISIAPSVSPFVFVPTVMRLEKLLFEGFLNDFYAAEEASRLLEEKINARIQLNLKLNPELRAEYERRIAIQKKIDERRARDLPVPVSWIDNTFHRRYYEAQGWLEQ